MAGNFSNRIEQPLRITSGPLPGEKLLESFRDALLSENVFRMMFGDTGKRIFIHERPSLNETILPAVILNWRSESYSSNDVYLDGSVDLLLLFPAKLRGDFQGQRRIANMIQRWMGGAMNLWAQNPGLTRFGFGSEWNYGELAQQQGLTVPMVSAILPYRFDLLKMQMDAPGFDPNRPLDDSDVGFIESIGIQIINQETNEVLEEVIYVSGQENPGLGQ